MATATLSGSRIKFEYCGLDKAIAILNAQYAVGTLEVKLLSSLKHLKELGIMSPQVTDNAIEYLLPLTTLHKLYLFETQISENGFARLRSGLPNCDIES